MGINEESGQLVLVSLKQVPMLESGGYLLAVAGVLMVGISRQLHSAEPASEAPVAVAAAEQ